ncbi:MAG: AAA domain-containing protein [Cytophagaceae bacterium]|nr:AAA domain-containing protein [Cytophagaceae bacterium]MDW8455515.1 AAA domain-containing protein [Cytophagaceae bacterium]
MSTILNTYIKKLSNLTAGSRSLCILKPSATKEIDLHRTDYLYKQPSFDIIEQLLKGKEKIFLCDVADSRDEHVNIFSRDIKKLYRQNAFIQEERGVCDLYLAWPFVHGRLSKHVLIRCPLMYFPVEFVVERNQWHIKQRQDVAPVFNKSFLLAYAHYLQLPPIHDSIDGFFEDCSRDSTEFRTQLYHCLKTYNVVLNFNQELFFNKLLAFEHLSKEILSNRYGEGELKLHSEACIGLYPQADSYIAPDYEEWVKNDTFTSLDEFFENFNATTHKHIREENMHFVFPVDETQEQALIKIKQGQSLVVQGPPGTGKSQLICNLIADAIATGKNVLLVCQKRVALDVVHSRLATIGLKNFTALVHDFRNDRKTLYQQIQNQIENIEDYQKQNNSLDTVYLERRFLQVSRKIDELTEQLNEFKKALFRTDLYGISIKELYLTSSPNAPYINLPAECKKMNHSQSQVFESSLRKMLPYAKEFETTEYPWKHRKPMYVFNRSDIKDIITTMNEVANFVNQFNRESTLFSAYQLLLSDIPVDEIDLLKYLLNEKETFQSFIHYKKYKRASASGFKHLKLLIEQYHTSDTIERHLTKSQLSDKKNSMVAAVNAAYKASKHNLSWFRWKLFSPYSSTVKKLLRQNQLPFNKKGVKQLKKMISNRLVFEKSCEALVKKYPWLYQMPDVRNKERDLAWLDVQTKALQAKQIVNSNPSWNAALNQIPSDHAIFIQQLTLLCSAQKKLNTRLTTWQKYLAQEMIEQLFQDGLNIERCVSTLENDFDNLTEYDRLLNTLNKPEKKIYERLLQFLSSSTTEDIIKLYQNSIRLAWINHIEEQYPILKSVSTLAMTQAEQELQELVAEKNKLCAEILLLKAREQTYKDNEYNRLRNRITYRELLHQVTKKKKIWPLRKLLENHHEELFRLIPCWMASPDTVSAIFPLHKIFDLIIFDEASQCYAEYGLPSLYRGKQVVIAGDSKQLRPGDLYKIRWEDNENEQLETDVESLLELSSLFLPSAHLQYHYRSKAPELIEFSNHNFYAGRLKMIPESKLFNDHREPSIQYIHVDGVWQNNVNHEEALKISEIINSLLMSNNGLSIGVITFNYHQAEHIKDILEASPANELRMKNVFVKNLENVQGDEYDVVLFSIGYAPDSKGRFLMHFGLLNNDGGENRLNVAISRAREKIYIIASIYPHQLKTEEAKYSGPKLLKQYLEYAFNISNNGYNYTYSLPAQHNSGWYLKDKILTCDIQNQFLQNLPFADLALLKDNTIDSLIITDDDIYYKMLSAKGYHVYLPASLSAKGWKHKKIFSRNYWLADSTKQKLIEYS